MKCNGAASSWTRVQLGDLGEWFGGGTPSKSIARYWQDGSIPWVSPKDMKEARISGSLDHITEDALKESATRLVPSGSVLVVTRSGILEHTLPVAVTTANVAINQDLKALVLRNDILPDFVFYALRWSEKQILHTCSKSGTTVANISFNEFLKYQIPLPPIDQQRPIVDTIARLFSHLDSTQSTIDAALRKCSRLRAATIASALQGNWPKVELGDIIHSLRNGVFVSRPSVAPPGVRIFRISAVRPMELDAADVRFAPVDIATVSDYLVEPGDILFTRYSGNPRFVGSCAVVPNRIPPTLHPDKLIRVTVDRSRALPEFVSLSLNNGESRREIEQRLKTTAGQVGIAGGQLRTVRLQLPPMEIQTTIVAQVTQELSVIKGAELQLHKTLKRLGSTRQSILAQAFSGMLTSQGAA